MENKCSTESGCCATTHTEECCPTQSESCCPVETATKMWKQAFFQAMKEAHVEVLKAKIHKAWGPKMDKAADVVLEAMEAQWSSMLGKAKSEIDLKERLAKIMTEGKK